MAIASGIWDARYWEWNKKYDCRSIEFRFCVSKEAAPYVGGKTFPALGGQRLDLIPVRETTGGPIIGWVGSVIVNIPPAAWRPPTPEEYCRTKNEMWEFIERAGGRTYEEIMREVEEEYMEELREMEGHLDLPPDFRLD